eukprot:scaffold3869_cov111-Isochrysis_galbana.AAC.1
MCRLVPDHWPELRLLARAVGFHACVADSYKSKIGQTCLASSKSLANITVSSANWEIVVDPPSVDALYVLGF